MKKIIIFIILVSFDLVSKYFIKNSLLPNQFIELNNFLNIVFVKNYGISFGLFSGYLSYWLLVFIGLIIVLFIFYLMMSSNRGLEKNAYFVIIIGAVGNILDRALNSYVVDFISLHYKNFYWTAFNLADIYITIGIIMLLITLFIKFESK